MLSRRVAERFLMATKLTLGPGRKDSKGTESLARMELKAKSNGSLEEAVVSAGFYARKTGQTAYVYMGNSYGHAVWRVSLKPSEYLNPINNTGLRVVSVTPELVMSWHDIR